MHYVHKVACSIPDLRDCFSDTGIEQNTGMYESLANIKVTLVYSIIL